MRPRSSKNDTGAGGLRPATLAKALPEWLAREVADESLTVTAIGIPSSDVSSALSQRLGREVGLNGGARSGRGGVHDVVFALLPAGLERQQKSVAAHLSSARRYAVLLAPQQQSDPRLPENKSFPLRVGSAQLVSYKLLREPTATGRRSVLVYRVDQDLRQQPERKRPSSPLATKAAKALRNASAPGRDEAPPHLGPVAVLDPAMTAKTETDSIADPQVHHALRSLGLFQSSRSYLISQLVHALRSRPLPVAAALVRQLPKWVRSQDRLQALVRAVGAEDPVAAVAKDLENLKAQGAPIAPARPASRASGRPRGLAVSWFFAPYVGSADIDFFRRIKDLDADFDVLQVRREFRDEKVLHLDRDRSVSRVEILVDHLNPRSEPTRDGFLSACLSYYESNPNRFDFLISHSNEVHSHRAALEIKRRSGLPWIAYFGDPSAKNPYVRYLSNYPFFEEDNETERLTFLLADRLVFNNEYQQKLMLAEAPQLAAKSRVVHHAFDPEMYQGEVPEKAKPVFTFAHFGTLYSVKRKGDLVFRAVDRLLHVYPEYRDRFAVEFYGTMTDADRAAHAAMRHRDHVLLRGQVSYSESLQRMRSADALLLIDAFFDVASDGLDFNPFLPCKLTDYLGARRPIAGITMSAGLPAEVLRASGNLIADEQLDRIAYVLKRYIDGSVTVDYGAYDRFALVYQTAKMQSVVDEVLAGVTP